MEEGKGKESHGLLGALQGVKGMIIPRVWRHVLYTVVSA